jgi:hypothetical protein
MVSVLLDAVAAIHTGCGTADSRPVPLSVENSKTRVIARIQ